MVWDYRKDGVAHYGMLADYRQDIRTVPTIGERVYSSMMKNAEMFAEMWEKAEKESSWSIDLQQDQPSAFNLPGLWTKKAADCIRRPFLFAHPSALQFGHHFSLTLEENRCPALPLHAPFVWSLRSFVSPPRAVSPRLAARGCCGIRLSMAIRSLLPTHRIFGSCRGRAGRRGG